MIIGNLGEFKPKVAKIGLGLSQLTNTKNKLTYGYKSKKELESKYKNEKPFFCGAPWETPIIQEDGKITPCGMPVREHNKDFILGDISKGDTIKGSWCGKKMQKLRALHKKGEWYKENMCRVCVKMKRTGQHKEFQPNIK